MSRLPDLAERIDRLVLRHEELQRTNTLLEQQLHTASAERDSLRSRLAAARSRIDALLERLPPAPASSDATADAADVAQGLAPARLPEAAASASASAGAGDLAEGSERPGTAA